MRTLRRWLGACCPEWTRHRRPTWPAGLRVGVPTDAYWAAADPVIDDAVQAAVGTLAAAGARIVELRTPMIDELAASYHPIVGAEAYTTHAEWLASRPQDYQPFTHDRLPGRPAAGSGLRRGPAHPSPARCGVARGGRRRRRAGAAHHPVIGHPDRPVHGRRERDDRAGAGLAARADPAVQPPAGPRCRFPAGPDGAPDPALPAGVQLVGITQTNRLLAIAAATAPPPTRPTPSRTTLW